MCVCERERERERERIKKKKGGRENHRKIKDQEKIDR